MKNDNHVWDNKHPTAQMLGRWQPWHAGHQKLFEETLRREMLSARQALWLVKMDLKELQNKTIRY